MAASDLLLPHRLVAHCHSTTWVVGRLFGFQAFNATPHVYGDASLALGSAPKPVPKPSTIPLAGDHLVSLLGSQYARLVEAYTFDSTDRGLKLPGNEPEVTDDVQDRLFRQAVLQLHTVVFESYANSWCPLVNLQKLPQLLVNAQRGWSADSWHACHSLLSQIGLFLLLWVEGVNLRHMAEMLWLLYWILLHCPPFIGHCLEAQAPDEAGSKCCNTWRLRARTLAGDALDAARSAVGLGGTTFILGLNAPPADAPTNAQVTPLAAALVGEEEYRAAVQQVFATLHQALEQELPTVTLHQLARELEHGSTCLSGRPLSEPVHQHSGDDVNEHREGLRGWDAHVDYPGQPGGIHDIAEGVGSPAVAPEDTDLDGLLRLTSWHLVDMALHGDGGWVVDRLVTPLFLLLAHEMDALAAEDAPHRLGYDDVNESCCHSDVVWCALEKLGVSRQALKKGAPHDVYRILTVHLGAPQPSDQPGMVDVPAVLENAATCVPFDWLVKYPALVPLSAAGLIAAPFIPSQVAIFWSMQVVVKTFIETRTWWAVVRVFWRVWALNYLGLHFLLVIAFFGPDPLALSSLVPAHALLVACERISVAVASRRPGRSVLQNQAFTDLRVKERLKRTRKGGKDVSVSGAPAGPSVHEPIFARLLRRIVPIEGQPILMFGGWLEFVIVGVGLLVFYIWRVKFGYADTWTLDSRGLRLNDIWYIICALYAAIHAAHWLVTQSDGHMRSLNAMLHLPHFLGAYSSRPRPRHHIQGSLSLGWVRTILQAVSFTLVYAVKWAFEYFVICQPMVIPVRALLTLCWPCLGGSNFVNLPWVLVVLRAAPAFVLCQIDGMLAYTLLIGLYTMIRGVVYRGLITLYDWSSGDVARDFHSAAGRWWSKCVSAPARARQLQIALYPAASGASRGGHNKNPSHSVMDLPLLLEYDTPAPATPTNGPSSGNPGRGLPHLRMSRSSATGSPTLPLPPNDDAVSGSKAPPSKARARARQGRAKSETLLEDGDAQPALQVYGGSQMAGISAKSGSANDGFTAGVLEAVQWRAFTAAWDSLVADLRSADLLNDAEAAHLELMETSGGAAWLAAWLEADARAGATNYSELGAQLASAAVLLGAPAPMGAATGSPLHQGRLGAGVLGPVLLPGLVHDGVVQRLVDGGGGGGGASGLQAQMTLAQLRGVVLALGAGMGLLTADEVVGLMTAGNGWRAVPRLAAHQEGRQALLNTSQQLAQVLNDVITRVTKPVDAAKPMLTAMKNVLKGLELESRAARTMIIFKSSSLERHIVLLGQVQERLSTWGIPQGAQALERLLTLPGHPGSTAEDEEERAENPLLHRLYPKIDVQELMCLPGVTARQPGRPATSNLPAALLTRSLQAVLGNAGDCKPRSGDARKALASFLNSLAMDTLTSAPSLATCPSLCTLTPLYHEDVMYALEANRVVEALMPETPVSPLVEKKAVHGRKGSETDSASDMLRPSPPPPLTTPAAASQRPGLRLSQAGNGQAPHTSESGAGKARSSDSGAVHGRSGDNGAGKVRSSAIGDSGNGAKGGAASKPASGGDGKADVKARDVAKLAAGLTDLLSAGSEQEGSVALITYLQSIYQEEWLNFKERVGREAALSASDAMLITPHDFAVGGALQDWGLELQLWASYRGQLLARTVRGMECYARAIQVLAAQEFSPGMGPHVLAVPEVARLVQSKYMHVVSAQGYGAQRKSREVRDRWAAQGVELLLRRHPALRVAYLDTAGTGQPSYSVLLHCAHGAGDIIEEVYRVRLPANPFSGRGIIIGEGKPENQNHAVIFCLSEAVQTIDMNQDNSLSEALKLPNVLKELNLHTIPSKLLSKMTGPGPQGKPFTCHKALKELNIYKAATMPTAIVGLREWIFSNRAGSLGSFSAATEYAFSSVIQRGQAEGGVRMHYGHPDCFNKLHIMTRGGLSKATRSLHVSEDVFAGLSHMGRGALIKQVEHSAVGKGRDMGLDSIMAFETKIAAGNAHVFLARDLARFAPRLDLFRLLHMYYSGLGYFTTALFTVFAVAIQVISMVALTLAGADRVYTNNGENFISILYATPLAIVTGLVGNVPYIAQLFLDEGAVSTVFKVAKQLICGSLMFFAFRLQTTCHHFYMGLTFPGGAGYIATGRGFAYRAVSFTHLFSLYGRSHLLPGAEIVALLFAFGLLLAAADYTIREYASLTWPMWLHAFSLLVAPFWFSPESFQWGKVSQDWAGWKAWLFAGEVAGAAGSWAQWNRRQLDRTRNWHGKHIRVVGSIIMGVLLDVGPYALMSGLCILRLLKLGLAAQILIGTLGIWAVAVVLGMVKPMLLSAGHERVWFQYKLVAGMTLALVITAYFVVLGAIVGWYGGLPVLLVVILHCCMGLALHRAALHLLPAVRFAWLVDGGFWLQDYMVGGFLLCVVSVLCLGGLLARLQDVLMFSVRYANTVREGKLAWSLAQMGRGGLKNATVGRPGRPGDSPGDGGTRDSKEERDEDEINAELEEAVQAVERENEAPTHIIPLLGQLSEYNSIGHATMGRAGNPLAGATSRAINWLRRLPEGGTLKSEQDGGSAAGTPRDNNLNHNSSGPNRWPATKWTMGRPTNPGSPTQQLHMTASARDQLMMEEGEHPPTARGDDHLNRTAPHDPSPPGNNRNRVRMGANPALNELQGTTLEGTFPGLGAAAASTLMRTATGGKLPPMDGSPTHASAGGMLGAGGPGRPPAALLNRTIGRPGHNATTFNVTPTPSPRDGGASGAQRAPNTRYANATEVEMQTAHSQGQAVYLTSGMDSDEAERGVSAGQLLDPMRDLSLPDPLNTQDYAPQQAALPPPAWVRQLAVNTDHPPSNVHSAFALAMPPQAVIQSFPAAAEGSLTGSNPLFAQAGSSTLVTSPVVAAQAQTHQGGPHVNPVNLWAPQHRPR